MSTGILITPSELEGMAAAGGIVLIDTRAPDAYAAGHIAGAVYIHDIFSYLATTTPDGVVSMKEKFAERFGAAGLGGEETAVIYEGSMDTGFGQSCRGYTLLKYFGYPHVKILHGGVAAWQAEGKPLTTDAPAPTPKTFPVDSGAATLFVHLEEMKAAGADDDVVKLDTRDVDEWVGTSSSPYGKDFCPRKGRIPGARWIEWYRMMKPTPAGKMLKAKEEILAECATVGVDADTPVVLYCFKGARASNTLVALKEAGIKDVRLYFGSWNEWSRDPSLPIEEGFPGAKAAGATPVGQAAE